jgi:hypothetical protein
MAELGIEHGVDSAPQTGAGLEQGDLASGFGETVGGG